MENASKAIIIAGSVLIGVMILTMFVYVFRAAANTNKSYDDRQAKKQLEAYNAQFEIYNKYNNTITELLTAINLAYDTNVSCDYDPQNTVFITIKIDDNHYYNLLNTIKLDSNNKPIIKKNTILPGSQESTNTGNAISIYDLINKSFSDLGIVPQTSDIKNDTFLKSKLTASHKTIYKYLFSCEKIDYHKENGKISYMKFEVLKYKNWTDGNNTEDDSFSIYDNANEKFYKKGIN